MLISLKAKAGTVRFLYYLFTFSLIVTIALIIYFIENNAFVYVIAVALIYNSLLFYSWYVKFNYFGYDDSSNKLLFRFYSLAKIFKKYQSVEIDKDSFSHFEISSKLFGLKKSLVLFQSTNRGVAKYPPISLSLLSKDELDTLSDSLKVYSEN